MVEIKKLKLTYRKLEELIPYVRNSRQHSQTQIKQIASSIKEFGFCNPILISTKNDIVAGHGRALAAELLGMKEVPTVELGHLTDAQRKAYVIADNRLAENASWDTAMLNLEMKDLKLAKFDNFDVFGFDDAFWHTIEKEDEIPDFEPIGDSNQGKLDEKEPFVCPACNHEFFAS